MPSFFDMRRSLASAMMCLMEIFFAAALALLLVNFVLVSWCSVDDGCVLVYVFGPFRNPAITCQ